MGVLESSPACDVAALVGQSCPDRGFTCDYRRYVLRCDDGGHIIEVSGFECVDMSAAPPDLSCSVDADTCERG